MGFKETLIRNVITPHTSQIFTNSIGKILAYDDVLNKAEVLVSSSGDFTVLKDVPVQISGRGVMSGRPKLDDLVYVQYNNGSIFQPKIVGFADEDYEYNTRESSKHLRKGTLLHTYDESDEEVIPRTKRRFDKSNNPCKHMSFRDISASEAISQKNSETGYFNNEELGLFHPVLSSLVKLKDNGDIDIFTGTNLGIRINRNKRTIEMFGDISTNSQNWKVVSNNVTIIAEDNLDIECSKLNVKAKGIYVNEEKLNV